MGKKFTAPENLQDLDAAALEAAVESAYASYSELAAVEANEVTDEQLAELSAINDFVTAAKAENQVREEAAAVRAETLASIKANLEQAPAEEETSAEDAAPAEEAPEEEAPAEEPAPVQKASIQRPANFTKGSLAARAAKSAPAQVIPEADRPQSSLVAAANVAEFAGQKFSNFADAATLITKQLNALPTNAPAGTVSRQSALVINLPENKFSTSAKGKDFSELLMAAGNESRLKGGSLVAAGGWGAPSERSLDFCELESIEGLISLPEVSITRGGIDYTKGPTFADVVNNSTGFWDMTEAVAEAGTEQKTSLRPEIPEFTGERLDAVGVMMEAGLLLRQGWPELVDRYAKLLMVAHQYKLAQKTINQIHAFTGTAKPVAGGFGNALDILHILELIAIGERQRNAMSPKQTLEALIPSWVHAVIRADLAQRTGVDTISVTDAQIDAHFTARNIKVQWLNHYQNLVLDPTTKLATKYPETLEVIMYPAGTFVRGVAPVITLDTVYDSVNLKKNDYVHLFVEQGTLVTNPCGDGQRISFPLYANGRRAFTSDANDNLFAPVANV